jgi:hypothetical protein
MKVGDWVAMPSKMNPTIHIGEVTAPYKYDPTKPAEHRHSVSVNWFAQDIPRERFDQDILYSLGAFMTFCQIKRNDAEARVRAMAENDWKSSKAAILQPTLDDEGGEEPSTIDIEEIAQDQLSRLIIARFKGDGLEDLVGAILKAQAQDRKSTFNFLGFTFYWGKSRRGKPVIKLKTDRKRKAAKKTALTRWIKANRHLPRSEQHQVLSAKLRGLYHYYGVSDNISVLLSLRRHVTITWRK